ncbi:UTRA domain-containing protein [Paraburkholderia sacchari]|uniref:UTRA domain-containing protein n=1 Tax=Paraburkholderia sacchari TaxID=159450 RepID=UPI0039A71E73
MVFSDETLTIAPKFGVVQLAESERSTTLAAHIRQSIEMQIDGKLLLPGAKLPSERELSELFGTTRTTVKEALVAMEAEGRIYCEDRRGWFVAPPRLIYNPLYRSPFHQIVTDQKRCLETRVLLSRTIVATPAICQNLELPTLSRVHEIHRLRKLDGRVVMLAKHYLKPEKFPRIFEHDLSQSLTTLYQQSYGIRYGRSRFEITPTAAWGEVAQALMLTEGSQILMISSIVYDQNDEIVEFEIEHWRHDAVRIIVDSVELERIKAQAQQ